LRSNGRDARSARPAIPSGVLELRGEGETAGYSGVDLELLEVLADVRRLGLGDVFPVSVAVPYMAAVRKLVELERARR